MSLLIFIAALGTAPTHPVADAASCPPTAATIARDNRKSPQARKLGELPPASGYAAVYRQIDGCEVPLPIQFDPTRRR